MIFLIETVFILCALLAIVAVPAIRHARRVEANCFDVIADSRLAEAAAVRAVRESGDLKLRALSKAHATDTARADARHTREIWRRHSKSDKLYGAIHDELAALKFEHAKLQFALVDCELERDDAAANLERFSGVLSRLRLDHDSELIALQNALDRQQITYDTDQATLQQWRTEEHEESRAKIAALEAEIAALKAGAARLSKAEREDQRRQAHALKHRIAGLPVN
jgi:chromosome segregation ATPase